MLAWLTEAKRITEQVIHDFSEDATGFFFYWQPQEDVIVRKKEIYDGATPIG